MNIDFEREREREILYIKYDCLENFSDLIYVICIDLLQLKLLIIGVEEVFFELLNFLFMICVVCFRVFLCILYVGNFFKFINI